MGGSLRLRGLTRRGMVRRERSRLESIDAEPRFLRDPIADRVSMFNNAPHAKLPKHLAFGSGAGDAQ